MRQVPVVRLIKVFNEYPMHVTKKTSVVLEATSPHEEHPCSVNKAIETRLWPSIDMDGNGTQSAWSAVVKVYNITNCLSASVDEPIVPVERKFVPRMLLSLAFGVYSPGRPMNRINLGFLHSSEYRFSY